MSGNTTIDLNYSGGEHSALQSLRTAQESPQGMLYTFFLLPKFMIYHQI
jgi:hypothetical protein